MSLTLTSQKLLQITNLPFSSDQISMFIISTGVVLIIAIILGVLIESPANNINAVTSFWIASIPLLLFNLESMCVALALQPPRKDKKESGSVEISVSDSMKTIQVTSK